MSDIVWAINPKNDSLQFMEDRMHAFASSVCSSKNIIPHFNTIDFHELKLPMEVRKNIFLIFKEAVNNAAKYSSCTSLTVNLERNNGTLVLEVKDNGTGFNEKEIREGNGLTNMHKRAGEIRGALSIMSKTGEGTGVLLKVRLP